MWLLFQVIKGGAVPTQALKNHSNKLQSNGPSKGHNIKNYTRKSGK